jgi:enamine deaminase RidA (YjgF/YER057c/UK114 family)
MTLERIETGRPYEQKVRHGAGTIAEGKLFYTSGLTSRDRDGNIVGRGDMTAQIRQAFSNVGDALRAAGTDFPRVVKYTIYVTDIDAYLKVASDITAIFTAQRQASTLIQVARLAHPDLWIEVEAIATLD